MLPCQRSRFNLPRDVSYLNCAYLSPLLDVTEEAAHKALQEKKRPWEVLPDHFFSPAQKLKQVFAQLTGVQAQDIAIVPAVSYGIALAARNVSLRAGQNIVILEEQFPSNVYAWLDLAKEKNAEIRFVKRVEGQTWTDGIVDAINDHTGVVALPNCHWTDGSLINLKAVSQVCQVKAIPLVLDLTQSLGAMPIDLSEIKPAFAVAAGYKWLLGPYGISVMYAAPEYQQGRPLEFNWLNRKDSEDFAGLVDYKEEFQAGSQRYDVGERSNMTHVNMLTAALEQINQWGVDNIAKTLSAFNLELAEKAAAKGLIAPRPEARAPHILGLRFSGRDPRELAAKLAANNVYVSVRGSALRVSPHLYNDQVDMQRLLDAL